MIHLWSLEREETLSAGNLIEAQARGTESLLFLIQTLVEAKLKEMSPVWLVTNGTLPVEENAVQLEQTCLNGFYRTVLLEHPEISCKHVDVDLSLHSLPLKAVFFWRELQGVNLENEVAYRNEIRYVPRLNRLRKNKYKEKYLSVPESSAFQLNTSSKDLSTLYLKPISLPNDLGPLEIAIQVKATGLNFRDVLNAMGLYPGDAGLMGIECSGTVTAVGDTVSNVHVGDQVLGFGEGLFANVAVGNSQLFVPKPSRLTFEEAAAIPVVFSTAYEALIQLARLREGDKILIHTAAGGVGLAAVQIAQHIGAEIYATAGSEEKQEYLRKLGVTHIYHSRNCDYADLILQDTGGRGVDVVLNSLSSEGFYRKFNKGVSSQCALCGNRQAKYMDPARDGKGKTGYLLFYLCPG